MSRHMYIDIVKARVKAVRKFVKGGMMPQAFASSGIPLKAAIYFDERIEELKAMADEYISSSNSLDGKLYFFYQFDMMVQEIPSTRIDIPNMDELESIRAAWFLGEPMNSNQIGQAERYYGYTIAWLMNALVSRFNDVEEEKYKNCFEEMSLCAAYGLPNKWAAQIYLCGINSRKISVELSKLIREPEEITSLSVVSELIMSKSSELINDENCSVLAKEWLNVFNRRPTLSVKRIQSVKNFYLKKDTKKVIPDLLLCKKRGENTFLCSVDYKYKRGVMDTKELPFSVIADIPGVFFKREGNVWEMKNVNPYISVVRNLPE